MAYRVSLSNRARLDLSAITSYITGRESSEIADKYVNWLLDRALLLDVNPYQGSRLPRNRNVRKIAAKSYLILYTVNDPEKTVRILRFWHGARNPRSLRLPL